MSTKLGQTAENLAATYLEQQGLSILERNLRTRWSEIDIVASSGEVIHFVEVKYRRSSDFGTGFDYITADKSNRLRRAAAWWMARTGDGQGQYQIDVISVIGELTAAKIDYLSNAHRRLTRLATAG